MTGFIVLDTNIYRQLGLKFLEHIDYVNLTNFCYASGFEMAVCEIVSLEYIDYYKKEILGSKIEKLQQIIKSLKSIPHFETIKAPRLDHRKMKALSDFESQINSPHFKFNVKYVDPIRLTEFLLENKQQKDCTRDYLIWDSLISFAKQRKEDKICFITNDHIFRDNVSLRKGIDISILNRIEIYDSITDFLFKNGFKVDFITLSFLEQNIDYDMIIKDLFRNPSEILSYISRDYLHFKGMVRILKKEIEYKRVDKFYTYIDPQDDKLKFLAHIILKPTIIYKLPSTFKPDNSRLSDFEILISESSLNTFDNQGNPVYNQEVMSLVGGIIDVENKSILSQEIYDCFLDYYKGVYS